MHTQTLAPICLFVYSRLNETRLTIEALQQNFLAADSVLFIFSDMAKDEQDKDRVKWVRDYIHTITGFSQVTIIERTEHTGLANSIISGVTQIIGEYGKVIVLEDDLITSRNFLNFMNQALDYYRDSEIIQTINGYSVSLNKHAPEIYFQQRPFSWGWATWKDRWNIEIFDKEAIKRTIEKDKSILFTFNKRCGADIAAMLLDSLNNRNDSWYVRWTFRHFMNNMYSVYVRESFVKNIGFNQFGTHCKGINAYYSEQIDEHKTYFNFVPFEKPDKSLTRDFLNYFSFKHKLNVRIKLLKSNLGRQQLKEEILRRVIHLS